jgi:hypothetical protein
MAGHIYSDCVSQFILSKFVFLLKDYEIEIGGFGCRRSRKTAFVDILFPTICLDLLLSVIPYLIVAPYGFTLGSSLLAPIRL